jgi:hypothetical protein
MTKKKLGKDLNASNVKFLYHDRLRLHTVEEYMRGVIYAHRKRSQNNFDL